MARRVVIGQGDEIETGFLRRLKDAMRRDFHTQPGAAIAVSGMGVEVARIPAGLTPDDWKGRLFTVGFLDGDGVRIVAAFTDVGFTKNHSQTTGLDRPG